MIIINGYIVSLENVRKSRNNNEYIIININLNIIISVMLNNILSLL